MTDLVTATATSAVAAAAPLAKPDLKPARPFFSSGPCAKPPGWHADGLATASLGRSHRSKIGKSRIVHAMDVTRKILGIPDTHVLGIVPASDTGAVEMALWSMLGARPATMMAWESFGEGWVTDVVKQLKIDAKVVKAGYGAIPDLNAVDWATDVVFTWNGTTSGVRVPDGDWIADDRAGPFDLRRHLGRVRGGPAVGQAGCDDLFLAEGAGRRRRRTAFSSSARARSSGWKAIRRPGRCRRSSA
jgi:hypothetical protein